jgi:hypothetical protein
MPKLHHQIKSISLVKARAKIKLERNLGPEILAVLVDPKTIVIMLDSDGKIDYLCCSHSLPEHSTELTCKMAATSLLSLSTGGILKSINRASNGLARHARRKRITTGRFLFITSSRPTPPTNWLCYAANQNGKYKIYF